MNPNGPPTYNGFTKITNPLLGEKLGNLTGTEFVGKLLPSFVGVIFVVGSISFFFMLLWGAVSWILSGGDKAGLESAKNKISNAVIGLILMFATFAIVTLIENFFGLNILSIDIGPLVIQ